MSVRVMSFVWDNYPHGGSRLLLMLALADWASDDGGDIYPSIKSMAEKTRTSERLVQYHLRSDMDEGWIEVINSGRGGRGSTTEYRICVEKLKGANFAPFPEIKGATQRKKGCNPAQKRVQPSVVKGAKIDGLVCEPPEPSENHQEPSAPSGLDIAAWERWVEYRKLIRKPLKPVSMPAAQHALAAFGSDQPAVVEQSIANGWQGLFALKTGGINAAHQDTRSRTKRVSDRLDDIARQDAAKHGVPDSVG